MKHVLPKPLQQISFSSNPMQTCDANISIITNILNASNLCQIKNNDQYDDSQEFAIIDDAHLLYSKITEELINLKRIDKYIEKLLCKIDVISNNIKIIKQNNKYILLNIIKLAK
ncbi:Hypothetical_protein [Hexamita inflata]|uniref:Hypothetical_protein n=1 Tax=Hexamita inflata TaxID=28002 RepID=A0AA86QIV8_9EUKA|nr:Hypothetical protein HINF_LOCUS47944 [Hexamita inflata]